MAATNTLSLDQRYLLPYVMYFTKMHMIYINKYEVEISEPRDNFYLMQSNKDISSELDPGGLTMLNSHIEFIRTSEQHLNILEEWRRLFRIGIKMDNPVSDFDTDITTMKLFFNKKLVECKKIVSKAQNFFCFYCSYISTIDNSKTYTTMPYLYLKSIIIFKEMWRKFFMRALLDYTIMYRIFIVLEKDKQFLQFNKNERRALIACFRQDYSLNHLLNMCDWRTFVNEKDFFLAEIFNNVVRDISADGNLIKIQRNFAQYIATEDKLFLKKMTKDDINKSKRKRTFPVNLLE